MVKGKYVMCCKKRVGRYLQDILCSLGYILMERIENGDNSRKLNHFHKYIPDMSKIIGLA